MADNLDPKVLIEALEAKMGKIEFTKWFVQTLRDKLYTVSTALGEKQVSPKPVQTSDLVSSVAFMKRVKRGRVDEMDLGESSTETRSQLLGGL